MLVNLFTLHYTNTAVVDVGDVNFNLNWKRPTGGGGAGI